MIRIAICDDQEKTASLLEKYVGHFFEEKHVRVKIDTFQDGKSFWYEIDEDAVYHLIFLDIEMPGMSGMEVAGEIRKKLPEAILIFVSSYEKYVFDTFQYHAFRFIPKEQLKDRLKSALTDALREMQYGEGQYYVAETGRDLIKIPLRNIICIWREDKNAVFQLLGKKLCYVRKTLKQVYEDLPKEEFTWIDREICGLSHISKIEKDEAVLSDGTRLKIAKGKVYELKEQIRQYWVKREDLI